MTDEECERRINEVCRRVDRVESRMDGFDTRLTNQSNDHAKLDSGFQEFRKAWERENALLHAALIEVKTDVKSTLASMRTELKDEVSGIKKEFREDVDEIKAAISTPRILQNVGTLITILLGLATLSALLFKLH